MSKIFSPDTEPKVDILKKKRFFFKPGNRNSTSWIGFFLGVDPEIVKKNSLKADVLPFPASYFVVDIALQESNDNRPSVHFFRQPHA